MKKSLRTTALFGADEQSPPIIREGKGPGAFRLIHLYSKFIALFIRIGISKITHPKANRERGKMVRQMLENLGGLWIKLGQLIAMRTDLYHKEFCDEISLLQDRSYGFSGDKVLRIVERELGEPIWAVFSEFDDAPFAAASIAQVHMARLRTNKKQVVVKVQKPFAREYLKKDLAMIKSLISIVTFFGFYRHLSLREMSIEFNQIFEEELDFRVETVNLLNFRSVLKEHGIYSPRVYKRYSSRRIVVMEFIQGVTMSQYIKMKRQDPARLRMWLSQNKINPRRVGERLLLSVLRQLFEDNIFHGDLHPGNIMLLANSRVALIDLGSVGSTDKKLLRLYKQHLEAMENKEYTRAAELFIMMSPTVDNVDLEGLTREIARALRASEIKGSITVISRQDRAKVFSDTQDELNKTLGDYKLAPDWSFLKFGRAFATLEHTLAHLDSKMNFSKAFSQYNLESKKRGRERLKAGISNLPDTVSNTFNMLVDRIRKSSMPLTGDLKRGMMFLSGLFRTLLIPIWGAFVLGIWAFLYQHYNEVVSWLHVQHNYINRIVEDIPQIPELLWLLILVGWASLAWKYTQLVKRR